LTHDIFIFLFAYNFSRVSHFLLAVWRDALQCQKRKMLS
jgi:hypothetical protein